MNFEYNIDCMSDCMNDCISECSSDTDSNSDCNDDCINECNSVCSSVCNNDSDSESNSSQCNEEYDIFEVPIDDWNEEDLLELHKQTQELVDISIEHNYENFFSHNFKTLITTDVENYLVAYWNSDSKGERETLKKISENYVNEQLQYIEKPVYVSKHIDYFLENNIDQKLQYLRSKPQPDQKTEEWYNKRHNMITASNLWKILKSESSRNSLIYDKCKPQANIPRYHGGPMEWGNKYEPVSIMFYEQLYKTNVEDFGCITHDDYDFIGASPDGIVVDPNSPIHGRMLEIKNIVNRNITGIPKEEYWIQMQIQMETCDLSCCDFLETRFKEYDNEKLFYSDTSNNVKGVLLHFSIFEENSYIPHYEYYDLSKEYCPEKIKLWMEEKKQLNSEKVLFKVIYYYLEEYSCVTVERNIKWFASIKNKVKGTWETILKERIEGFEHRCPRSRGNSITVTPSNKDDTTRVIHNLGASSGVCLIRLDSQGNNMPSNISV